MIAHVVITIGLLLTVALLAGEAAVLLRLPKVTAYLLVGVLFGHSALDIVPEEHLMRIQPLANLAIALVLFNLGSQFPLARVRRIFRNIVRLSVGDLGFTLLAVAVGLSLLGLSWKAALLLGILAMATAPATTILVLKETESEGMITEYAQALVVVNNLVAIVAFELVFLAIEFARGGASSSLGIQAQQFLLDLFGSAGLGVGAGLVVSYCYGLVAQNRRLVLLVGIAALLLGLCEFFDAPYLLAFLAMGATTANASYHNRQILADLDRLTGLLCVMFFVVSGVELEVQGLWQAGMIGMAYIGLRCAGKYFGIRWRTESRHEPPVVRRWLGATLISQAGAAIALAAIAAERDPELGRYVQTIILGTIPFFELAGPILIRQSVLRAGEVPLAYAIPHAGIDLLDQLRTLWNRILLAFGLDPWHGRSAADLTVNEIMRKNVHVLKHSLTFDEILVFIEHNRDNTYPVVNEHKELVGVIRYRELSEALVDHSLGSLVRAADVATSPGKILYPDDSVSRVCQILRKSKDDCLPVVSREISDRLLGIVRRRDVLRWLIRQQGSAGNTVE